MNERARDARGSRRVGIAVVGAGPAGIGAALRLKELGALAPSWLVAEAGTGIGGLAGTVCDDAGYHWDLGGHVIYSHAPEFDRMLDLLPEVRWSHVARAGWVWHHDRFVPAPFQQNLRQLSTADLDRCANGLATRVPAADDSFDAWLLQEFGAGLADTFFRPFNIKMWGYPTTRLDSDWVTHRSGSSAANVPKIGALRALPPAETFPYPEGGTGEIWANAARMIGLEHFATQQAVVSIDAANRVLRFASGDELAYDALVSSMPLDLLLTMIEGRDDLVELASRLVRSSTWLVGLGFAGTVPDLLAEKRWMYFSDLGIPFHRATVLSNYSDRMVPDPERSWSLLCEVSDTPTRPAAREVVSTVRHCAQDLVHGWGGGDVCHVWSQRLTHGYPTPFLGRRRLLPSIHQALEALGIFSRGRFGAWRYEVSNQDHAFMQGYEAVNRIVLGERETTLTHDAPTLSAAS